MSLASQFKFTNHHINKFSILYVLSADGCIFFLRDFSVSLHFSRNDNIYNSKSIIIHPVSWFLSLASQFKFTNHHIIKSPHYQITTLSNHHIKKWSILYVLSAEGSIFLLRDFSVSLRFSRNDNIYNSKFIIIHPVSWFLSLAFQFKFTNHDIIKSSHYQITKLSHHYINKLS